MNTSIDRHLKIVIEIPRGERPPIYVHSTGMSVDTFEQYFDLCGPTMNALNVGGYGYYAPRYASLVFKQIAMRPLQFVEKDKTEEHARTKAALEARLTAFYNELHRLTFVVALKDGRWDMVPVDDAKAMGAISEEEYSRADAALVFFTCASQSVPPDQVEGILGGLMLFNSRIESLSCTEFVTYLQTLMKDGSSGKSPASSPPSSHGQSQTKASEPFSDDSTSQSSHGARPRHTGIAFSLPK